MAEETDETTEPADVPTPLVAGGIYKRKPNKKGFAPDTHCHMATVDATKTVARSEIHDPVYGRAGVATGVTINQWTLVARPLTVEEISKLAVLRQRVDALFSENASLRSEIAVISRRLEGLDAKPQPAPRKKPGPKAKAPAA